MVEKKVRVRFAPSPTGYMHIGNFRSALYDYLFAKQNNGDFILRIEDTDQSRYVEGSVQRLIETLENMGLNWDEGPKKIGENEKVQAMLSPTYSHIAEFGEFTPYIQSERLDIYKEHVQKLIDKDLAYYCFCSNERLEQMREKQIANKQAPMYDRHCLNLSKEEIEQKLNSGEKYVIRLKVPQNQNIVFEDIVREKVSFNSNTIDDQVLLKSDGFPTYHLANVIDDHQMQISHVIRGEEWLPSTPKHILLYMAFGWEIPQFAHLPLLLNPDKTKLSKRQGDVAVEDYLNKGYLKEALINFVALLGWNPGEGSTEEIFSLDELIKKFSLKKVHKAGAVFDIKKLDWINSQYIKKLPVDEIYEKSIEFLKLKEIYFAAPQERQTPEYVKKVLTIEKERLSKFSEVGDENPYLFLDIKYDTSLLKWKEMTNEDLQNSLNLSKNTLLAIPEEKWELQAIEKDLLNAAGENRGNILWPLRVALTGAQKSPSPFEVAWVLGKNETLKRIEDALRKI